MKRREILKWTAPVITVCVLPAHAQTSGPIGIPNPPLGSPPLTCEDQIQAAFDNYQRVNANPAATQQEVDNAFQTWIDSKQCRADEQVAVCDESSEIVTLSKAPATQSEIMDSCPEMKS